MRRRGCCCSPRWRVARSVRGAAAWFVVTLAGRRGHGGVAVKPSKGGGARAAPARAARRAGAGSWPRRGCTAARNERCGSGRPVGGGSGALRVAWVFASAPFWETVSLGQIYALLALPTALAWVLLERWPLLSGVLIGVVAAFKPNFLVWPALLAAGWAPAGRGERVGDDAGSACWRRRVFGPAVYLSWLGAISRDPANRPGRQCGAWRDCWCALGAGGLAPLVDGAGADRTGAC